MVEYKICMYLQFVSGDNPDSYHPGYDKLWFEILLDEYKDGEPYNTVDCNGFELPLHFMALSEHRREAMRETLMDWAAKRIAAMVERNGVEKYTFDLPGGKVDLMHVSMN